MNYNWNWGIFFEPSPEGTGTYADMLLSGLYWTIARARGRTSRPNEVREVLH